MYQSVKNCAELPRHHHNELLYALKCAPLLATGITPSDADALAQTDCRRNDKPVVMAAKIENTNFGKKVRATWSADAVTREITTQYHQAAIPMCALHRGVTSRKSVESVDQLFANIDADLVSHRDSDTLVISNDASSWSVKGPLDLWSIHHDYVLQTTTAPKNVSLKNIWRNGQSHMNKRGDVRSFPANKTLFQGWTGCMDSLLNDRLSLYCVRIATEEEAVKETEGARTAALIDDAVQVVVFEDGADKDRESRE